MPVPLVSVIIVCRNPGISLRGAVESARGQNCGELETLVIDGASSDGTCEWLETQRKHFATFLSEPDNGVYDAMNKGVAAARGDWILFLGADDRLEDYIVESMRQVLSESRAGVVVGETAYDNGRRYPMSLVSTAIRRNFVHHQAAFYRRSLFSTHGGFDTSLRIMADYDFNLRLMRAGVPFDTCPVRIAQCASGGLSDSGRWSGYREEVNVRHRHFAAWRCWLWDFASVVRWLRKRAIMSAR